MINGTKIANQISARLSLRKPQEESLTILCDVLEQLELSKEPDMVHWLKVLKAGHKIIKDFEREFPSLCFAIATGVGKTRLMGAIITYLYLAKGIKNFFILAPNLTIYDKLIKDFGDPAYEKYVFNGISE